MAKEATEIKKDKQQDIIKQKDQEIQEITKTRDEAIKREYDLHKELSQVKSQVEELQKNNQKLINQLNGLSELFDEQYQLLVDQTIVQKLNQKNFANSKQLLDLKINKFNKGEDE